MKKELGILLIAFIMAVGFSGAIAAAPPNTNAQGPNMNNQGPNMNNQGPNMNNFNRHRCSIVWQGSWRQYRNSFWWRISHGRMNFWWGGNHYRVTTSWNWRFRQNWVTIWRCR